MKHVELKFNCDQPWDSFDITPAGGFCHSCNKNVVDYSNMALKDVLNEIEKTPGGCGRFAIEHTDPDIITEVRVPKQWFAWATGLSLLMLGTSHEVIAQDQVKTEHVQVRSTNIPQEHDNPEKICPKESQSCTTVEPVRKLHRVRRKLYISRRFPFVFYRRPFRGKF